MPPNDLSTVKALLIQGLLSVLGITGGSTKNFVPERNTVALKLRALSDHWISSRMLL